MPAHSHQHQSKQAVAQYRFEILPEEFFTDERLRYYRNLHRRFPLWCGHWPAELKALPSGDVWARSELATRIVEEEGAPPDLLATSIDPPPDTDSVSWPRFYVRGPGPNDPSTRSQHTVEGCDPPVVAVLLAAMNYTCHPWAKGDNLAESEATPDLLDRWLARLRQTLQADPRDDSSHWWGLRSRVRRLQRDIGLTPPEEAREELKDYWVKVGREAGILPARRGGTQCELPDKFLARLEKQSHELVEEILQHEPREETREEVRQILTSAADADPVVPEQKQENVEFLRDHGREEQAEAIEESAVAEADERLATDRWCLRLAYPMLTPAEIEAVFRRTEGDLHKQRVKAAGRDILADRLPIARKTLLNRTSEFRS